MSLKNKLNRMKNHLSQEMPKSDKGKIEPAKYVGIPFEDEWIKHDVRPYYFDNDYCLIREVRYPISFQHGKYRFHELISTVKAWNNSNLSHPLSSADHSAEELFFFDTETTGLGGGVGNTIFLLGYASIKEDEVILRQHILPHPGAEVALYQSFLEKINYRTLVTYNGKSFDWPQVKTRHTLVREHVPKLPPFGHFDLYHAARRLWKHKLERLKLSVVEKEILGVIRENDVPGYLAPMIYFDFIERKDPEGMIGILKHNEIDILSLITLYTHLSYQLLQLDERMTRPESFEVGRWFEQLGENDVSKLVYQQLSSGSDEASYRSKLALAFTLKRQQSWEEALQLFIEVTKNGEDSCRIVALTEAAKIFEHKLKDYKEAYLLSSQAYDLLMGSNIFNKSQMVKNKEELKKRMVRLTGKLQKFPG